MEGKGLKAVIQRLLFSFLFLFLTIQTYPALAQGPEKDLTQRVEKLEGIIKEQKKYSRIMKRNWIRTFL